MLNICYHIKQLTYELAIYNNPGMTGKPLTSVAANDPDRTMGALYVPDIQLQKQDYYISVRIKDIFDQESKVRTVVLRELKP